MSHDDMTPEGLTACRQKAFGIERGRDFLVHLLRRVKLEDPALQGFSLRVLGIAVHTTRQLLCPGGAGLPIDLIPEPTPRAFSIDHDGVDHKPPHLFPIGGWGGRRMPDLRQVLR